VERISQTNHQPATQRLIVLVLGCTSLSIAAVGIVMTGSETTVLLPFIGLGLIQGARRLARLVNYNRYEHQRQQETRAYRRASDIHSTGKISPVRRET
jgi:hypothetical protein